MKEWICHDWLHRTNPERFAAGIQAGEIEHLTEFLTRELSVLGKTFICFYFCKSSMVNVMHNIFVF